MNAMSLNPSFFFLSVVTSTCLFLISAFLYSHRPVIFYAPSELATNDSRQFDLSDFLDLNANHPWALPSQSLVVILPVTSASFHRISDLLQPFLYHQEHVREVVVLCPDAIVPDVRRMLQGVFTSLGSTRHPDISVRWLSDPLEKDSAIIRAAADVATERVLVMDDTGLEDLPRSAWTTILRASGLLLPFGPKGVPLSGHRPNHNAQLGQFSLAKYLLPPFVAPSFLLSSFAPHCRTTNSCSWVDFGDYTATYHSHIVGGILLEFEPRPAASPPFRLPTLGDPVVNNTVPPMHPPSRSAQFIFFLPTLDDLRRAMALICSMRLTERMQIRILVYNEIADEIAQQHVREDYLTDLRCVVKYDILTGRLPLSFAVKGSKVLLDWLVSEALSPSVVVSIKEMDPLVGFLRSELIDSFFHGATVIQIPRDDLGYLEWMSALSVEEWKNWHSPQVDISVITKDRPSSLSRLLESLSVARYFGDSPSLRVNIDQDCDTETLRVATNLSSPFGHVFLHRRTIHGGLLPAVLESWYPNNDDSYGVLLEDDVEVSPLFYAWIKMTILRYRYGEATERIPNLFGVSLYQQKHLELRLEGRQSFNPRTYFSEAGLVNPTTPYLSQVPCSWGAVYFPEHWREFHSYLSFRLAELAIVIEDNVVEEVRSNNWSKSWKRYFIELVYLRGYVMLYPNYENFLSLSTNHLEVGSHVKVRSPENEQLFSLPLMQLQGPEEACKLLDMPYGRLPHANLLPVLNLTGFLTSLEEIMQRGNSRRLDLFLCDRPAELDEISSLMCSNTWEAPQ